jgi:hypothetical protein
MSKTFPCESCGRPRPQSGKAGPGTVCMACRRKRRPAKASRIHFQHAADKTAQHPTASWWATGSREEFNANLERERSRLQAIGADVPKSLRSELS